MKLLLLVICTLFVVTLFAQQNPMKYLEMDKFGRKKKSEKFYIGDKLTFKMKYDDYFFTMVIKDLDYDTGTITFENGGRVNVNNIEEVKTFKTARFSKVFSLGMYNFGAGWAVFSLGAALAGNPLTWAALAVPAVAAVVGFIVRKIFKERRFKINKKRQLRIIDLNPIETKQELSPLYHPS